MIILVGDIGGTHSRFRLLVTAEGEQQVLEQFSLSSADHDNATQMLDACVARLPPDRTIDIVCLAVAGPVRNGEVQLTNLPWTMDVELLRQRLGVQRVFILNDFEALAQAVADLGKEQYLELKPGNEVAHGPRLVLGAGTGLGVSLLIGEGEHLQVLATEAGHMDFAPQGELQEALLHYLARQYAHVSYERILSGPGIQTLYQFFRLRDGVEEGMPPAPEQITGKALTADDPCASQSMSLFASIMGAFTGNLALAGMTTGGIYIGGGIAPSILPILQDKSLIEAFLNKGRMRTILEPIPLRLITVGDAGLLGAEHYCLSQSRKK